MSNSLYFCINRASNPNVSSYSDRDWKQALEINHTEKIIKRIIGDHRKYTVSGVDEFGGDYGVTVNLTLDPDAEFDFFVSESCIHDGTYIFIFEAFVECIKKILWLRSYNEAIGEPPNGCVVNLIIGNLVALSEYNGSWDKPPDKPWLHERTTVLLPVKMWYTES